jgi:hypothetical protein
MPLLPENLGLNLVVTRRHLKALGITPGEYSDITRRRPSRKQGQDERPFFIPLMVSEKTFGSGVHTVLSFFDLMVLYILHDFKLHGMNRTLGRYFKLFYPKPSQYFSKKIEERLLGNKFVETYNKEFPKYHIFGETFEEKTHPKEVWFFRLLFGQSHSALTKLKHKIDKTKMVPTQLVSLILKSPAGEKNIHSVEMKMGSNGLFDPKDISLRDEDSKLLEQQFPFSFWINLNEVNREVQQAVKLMNI